MDSSSSSKKPHGLARLKTSWKKPWRKLASSPKGAETPRLYLSLTEKCMTPNRSSSSPEFNRTQCNYLAEKLKKAVENAHMYLKAIETWYSTFASPQGKASSLEIFKLLFVLGKEAEKFIQNCCKEEWILSAIMLTNATEHVSSIVFYLEFCTIMFSKRNNLGATPSMVLAEVADVIRVCQVEAEIVKKMSETDERRLCQDLNCALTQRNIVLSNLQLQLAQFLLERLMVGSSHDSGRFPEITVNSLIRRERVGSGATGTVHRVTWLGVDVAQKSFYGSSNPDFVQEVSILQGLYHPNIVSMFWFTEDEQQCQIIMELMKMDLHNLLEERLAEVGPNNSPFPYWETLDIMLQVAEGVLFLHQKNIVHRDLKSKNILVEHVNVPEVNINYRHVKVADFGLSKTKERSKTCSYQTPNRGTTRWMAPELMRIQANEHQRVGEDKVLLSVEEGKVSYPFKSDVYSFGILCYEILTGRLPFHNLHSSHDVKKEVLRGGRPPLPNDLSMELRILIESSWSPEPSARPSFVDICKKLRHLKCEYYLTCAWAKVPRCFNLDEIKRMTNDFNHENQLESDGEQIFKGVMYDTGEVVAVNRVPVDVSFKRQLEMLPGFQHNNILRCFGFCVERSEHVLVLEDTSNGTLRSWLEDAPNGTLRSWLKGEKKIYVHHHNWQVRKLICFGVANGIHFLHAAKIVHQNINPHIILLDAKLEPKISGFQLAIRPDELSSHGLKRQDSYRYYTAPEYEIRGQLSEKADVYSYGVVLLEIVSGQRANVGEKRTYGYHFLKKAWELYCLGVIEETIDRCLDLVADEKMEAIRIMKIALLCTHKVPERRPDMSQVVAMLHGTQDAMISSLLLEHEQELRSH